MQFATEDYRFIGGASSFRTSSADSSCLNDTRLDKGHTARVRPDSVLCYSVDSTIHGHPRGFAHRHTEIIVLAFGGIPRRETTV